jgi:hypothetical protein
MMRILFRAEIRPQYHPIMELPYFKISVLCSRNNKCWLWTQFTTHAINFRKIIRIVHWKVSLIRKLRCNLHSNVSVSNVDYAGLFKMIVGVLTTCHIQYPWDRSICIFLFNRRTLQVLVTYRTGALNVHPLRFYKHQHDNRVLSKLFVAWQRWWFQWGFWLVLRTKRRNAQLLHTAHHKRKLWEFLNPSVQLNTAIWIVLCMTSC